MDASPPAGEQALHPPGAVCHLGTRPGCSSKTRNSSPRTSGRSMKCICQTNADLQELYQLGQDVAQMLKQRQSRRLALWLARAHKSSLKLPLLSWQQVPGHDVFTENDCQKGERRGADEHKDTQRVDNPSKSSSSLHCLPAAGRWPERASD